MSFEIIGKNEEEIIIYNDRIEYRNERYQLHRMNGPAIEWNNGNKWWYQNGLIHRTNGPAIEHISGYKEWWIDGHLIKRKMSKSIIDIMMELLLCSYIIFISISLFELLSK